MEHFYTIQGEGFYSGTAAYFVRLGGCDVGCTWCDVKESWDASAHPQMELSSLVATIVSSGANICVITGGEPLMHQLDFFTELLHAQGLRVHIETSGTSPISGTLDWITFSPKRFKKPLPEFYSRANELKIVVSHVNDLRWAEEHKKQLVSPCKLYLQPEWDKQKAILPSIIDYVKAHPEWTISLQTHKFIGVD